jgi:hypothetical protein
MKKTKMIWAALDWANNVNGKQGVLDLANAIGINYDKYCNGCDGDEPHWLNECAICGTTNNQ